MTSFWIYRLTSASYSGMRTYHLYRILPSRLLATLGSSFTPALFQKNKYRHNASNILCDKHAAQHTCSSWGSSTLNIASSQASSSASALGDKNIYSLYDKRLSQEDCTALLEALTAEETKKLAMLKLEFEMIAMEGYPTPKHMSDKHWVHIFHNCEKTTERINVYELLFLREEAKKVKDKSRKDGSAKYKESQDILQKELEATGRLHPNTILLPPHRQDIIRYENSNLAYAMQFSPTLCIDFSFEEKMEASECVKTVQQILFAHGLNRNQREPFHVHFCNLSNNCFLYKRLHAELPKLEDIPITISKDSYLNHYPKSQLVYISPFGSEEMEDFHPDNVYILGATTNIVQMKYMIQTITKKEGIRHVRLPIDRYIKRSQKKQFALKLDQNIKTLLEKCAKKSWKEALQHVGHGKVYQTF